MPRTAADDVPSLALALDAFLAEHHGCWRLHGEGLDSGEDVGACWIECPPCAVVLVAPKYREEDRGFYQTKP